MVALIATVPVATNDLAPQPRAMSDYESAIAAIGRRQEVDAQVAAPTARSIVLGHGHRTSTVVLLLHGFTNSPLQFDSLARMLYRQGDNVYVPRLPQQAERVDGSEALSRITAEEMRGASDSAVDVARGLGDTIVVVGLSMGGTMAAWIAQYRTGVRRVILIAPLMALARIPAVFDVPLANLAVRLPNVSAHGSDDQQPDRELGWSSRAVGQILRLGMAVQRAAVDTAPAVRDIEILLNGHDHTISMQTVQKVAGRWKEHGATVHEYEISGRLGLPHDVIDPRQPVRRPDIVYPVIVALASGRTPAGANIQARF